MSCTPTIEHVDGASALAEVVRRLGADEDALVLVVDGGLGEIRRAVGRDLVIVTRAPEAGATPEDVLAGYPSVPGRCLVVALHAGDGFDLAAAGTPDGWTPPPPPPEPEPVAEADSPLPGPLPPPPPPRPRPDARPGPNCWLPVERVADLDALAEYVHPLAVVNDAVVVLVDEDPGPARRALLGEAQVVERPVAEGQGAAEVAAGTSRVPGRCVIVALRDGDGLELAVAGASPWTRTVDAWPPALPEPEPVVPYHAPPQLYRQRLPAREAPPRLRLDGRASALAFGGHFVGLAGGAVAGAVIALPFCEDCAGAFAGAGAVVGFEGGAVLGAALARKGRRWPPAAGALAGLGVQVVSFALAGAAVAVSNGHDDPVRTGGIVATSALVGVGALAPAIGAGIGQGTYGLPRGVSEDW